MDEFRISQCLHKGAEADGFGVGTKFTVSHYAPDIDIIYKLAEYDGQKVFKTSPQKKTWAEEKQYSGSRTIILKEISLKIMTLPATIYWKNSTRLTILKQ